MKKWLLPALAVCVAAAVGISYLGPHKAGDLRAYGVKSWSHYTSAQGFRIDYPTGWKVQPYDAEAGRGELFSHPPKVDAFIIAVRSHVDRDILEALARRCGSELSAFDQCQAATIGKDYFGYESGLAADDVISGQPAKVALFNYADPKNRKVQGYRITMLDKQGRQFCITVAIIGGDLAAVDTLKDKVAQSFKVTGAPETKR